MRRTTASTHPAPSSRKTEEEELRRALQEAGTGIRRSRNAMGRMKDYLAVAERFLAEGGPWLRLKADAVLARRESPESSYAFVHELDGLRRVLNRVGLKVAGNSGDRGREGVELGRLSAELRHGSMDPESE